MSETQPLSRKFVTVACEHCDGGIEFDSTCLADNETRRVDCPHCGLETEIFVIEEAHALDENPKVEPQTVNEERVADSLRGLYEEARKYFFGEGVRQDLVQAYKFVYLAGRVTESTGIWWGHDNEELVQMKEIMATRLNESEIKRAHRLADAEWDAMMSGGAIQAAKATEAARQGISSNVRREVWRRDQGKCVKCGSRRNLEYDHIIPVAKGGSNTARNIELLCEGAIKLSV